MKKLLLSFTLILCLKSYGQENPDKYYGHHYVAGAVMGGAVALMHNSPKVAFASAVVTGIGVGLTKELYDVKYLNHRFSRKDFIFTVLGSITTGYIVSQIKRHIHFRKTLRKV